VPVEALPLPCGKAETGIRNSKITNEKKIFLGARRYRIEGESANSIWHLLATAYEIKGRLIIFRLKEGVLVWIS